jgi:hypothetical protein
MLLVSKPLNSNNSKSDACTMRTMTAGDILRLSPRDPCRTGDLRSTEVACHTETPSFATLDASFSIASLSRASRLPLRFASCSGHQGLEPFFDWPRGRPRPAVCTNAIDHLGIPGDQGLRSCYGSRSIHLISGSDNTSFERTPPCIPLCPFYLLLKQQTLCGGSLF